MAMAVRVAMATLLRRRRARGPGLEHRGQTAGSPELVVPAEVKAAGLHQALLLGREPALEEALERGLFLGPEEEGVAGHEVHGRHVEAYGLHHVPGELPEGEPHEPGRLDHQVRQPAPQLPAHLGHRGPVDVSLLRLHGLQLLPRRVVLGDGQRFTDGNGLLDGLDDLQLSLNRTRKHFHDLLGCSSFQERSIKVPKNKKKEIHQRKGDAGKNRLHP